MESMLSADCHIPEHGDGGTERHHQARWLVSHMAELHKVLSERLSYSWARWHDTETEM